MPKDFKVFYLETYDGSRDPLDHFESFKTLMLLCQVIGGILYRATFKGVARHWYASLKPSFIDCFGE